ncbi:CD1247 N-terminal domain-containing protein [Natranaerofaba carboxydovora]|uniref:CD1247 N-terminal domain-containing protein n=1 Tax=Natranaerofaba carboxydovora TaxID=2742683 RepID=UPI001F136E71|nr:CD1247 N-terminal domain-containing protein [Natranaerofaba carboxydovora]UMZ73964.1 hypothetical protein ACONDI_01534 [Natranaerofaba carboxydovora]
MRDRMSYLNGLVDGLELSKKSKEGEVIKEITMALEEFAEMFEAMDQDLGAVEQDNEYLEERLNLLERDFYGDNYPAYDPGLVEIECPRCSEMVTVEEGILDENSSPEVYCPVCKDLFIFENNPSSQSGKEEVMNEEFQPR